jgi:hypothetical protein
MAASEVLREQDRRSSNLAVAALQVVLGAFTPLALISIGGVGIYSAPLLLPLLWITANACRGGGRWYFTVLAALLAAESAWAISWSLWPSLQLFLPLLAAIAIIVLFIKSWHRDLPLCENSNHTAGPRRTWSCWNRVARRRWRN